MEGEQMDILRSVNPADSRTYDTEQLRARFLLDSLFMPGEINVVYSHEDRMVLGSACPTLDNPLTLGTYDPLRSQYFCDRRELGVVNIGGRGTVTVDGVSYELSTQDVLYVGRGSRDIQFATASDESPAAFYLVACTAHVDFATRLMTTAEASETIAGSPDTANHRVIRGYIDENGVRSAQLVLGITSLKPGSVWNTMPCHTHDRRTEVYLYFDLGEGQRIVHLMGEPQETRSLIVANRQAVISPSWSVHCGAGTKSYAFVWAMAGENQAFADMDHVDVTAMR